jgi:prepilin-type N-terminal cleavage/methylation domain-containing protein
MKNNGFTLIEVIISIFLIGIIVVAVFPMFNQGFRNLFSFTSKTNAINEVRSDLINVLRGGEIPSSVTISSPDITIDFDDNDIDSISINSKAYSVIRDYSLPGKGEENLELEYYSYDN